MIRIDEQYFSENDWGQEDYRFLKMRVALWSLIEATDNFTRVQFPTEDVHLKKYSDRNRFPNGLKVNQRHNEYYDRNTGKHFRNKTAKSYEEKRKMLLEAGDILNYTAKIAYYQRREKYIGQHFFIQCKWKSFFGETENTSHHIDLIRNQSYIRSTSYDFATDHYTKNIASVPEQELVYNIRIQISGLKVSGLSLKKI